MQCMCTHTCARARAYTVSVYTYINSIRIISSCSSLACLLCIQLSGGSEEVEMTVNPSPVPQNETLHGSYDVCGEWVEGARRTLPEKEEEDCKEPEEETEVIVKIPEKEEEGSVPPEGKKPDGRLSGKRVLHRSQQNADLDSAPCHPLQPSNEMPVVEEMKTDIFPAQPSQQYVEMGLADRHSIPGSKMFDVECAKVGEAN